jgi:hypothetical protein
MYEVKDGTRTLRFEGDKLSFSTSWRQGAIRWIEFTLYKTVSGSYVLSRVGVSMVFHSSVCPLVTRYGLHESSVDDLSPQAVPCPECQPNFSEPIVYPERARYWTLVSEEADAVLNALYKYDDNGARYLTKVAERVLEQASEIDPEIDAVYRVEFIA